jgi:small subunit ribosomal protein S9
MRKTSVARVYLRPRSADRGQIRINDRGFEEFFVRPRDRITVQTPFELTQTTDQFDVMVNVRGGGQTGQAGAARHGISRALLKFDPAFRPVLKKAGMLTRDDRQVERKKYGLSGARKRYQYSKR